MTSNAFPSDISPAKLLYPDLSNELASTRRMLERVPDGNDDWKPHDKSMTLSKLATHVAELLAFGTRMITTSELDMAAVPWDTPSIANSKERLALFDKNAAELTSTVESATWESLSDEWVLRMGEQVYMKDRKSTLVRTMCISHIGHHRAQLGVYLRKLDLAVPGMYGPSADEM